MQPAKPTLDPQIAQLLKSIEVMAASAIWACDEDGCSSSMVMDMIDDDVDEAREIGGEGLSFIERISAIRSADYGPCTEEECPRYDMADDIVKVARQALGITQEMVDRIAAERAINSERMRQGLDPIY